MLVFSTLLWLRNRKLFINIKEQFMLLLLYLSTPLLPKPRPAPSLSALFLFATAMLCCIMLVFSLQSYCIRNPGTDEEAG